MLPRRNTRNTDTDFIKLLRNYRRSFEENSLPELRKRSFYLPPSQKRRVKVKKAEARRKKEERKLLKRQKNPRAKFHKSSRSVNE